jgi:hypothetical protein
MLSGDGRALSRRGRGSRAWSALDARAARPGAMGSSTNEYMTRWRYPVQNGDVGRRKRRGSFRPGPCPGCTQLTEADYVGGRLQVWKADRVISPLGPGQVQAVKISTGDVARGQRPRSGKRLARLQANGARRNSESPEISEADELASLRSEKHAVASES